MIPSLATPRGISISMALMKGMRHGAELAQGSPSHSETPLPRDHPISVHTQVQVASWCTAALASLLPQYGNYWIISHKKQKVLHAIRLPNTSLLILPTFHKYFTLFPSRFPVNCNILPTKQQAGRTQWTAPRPQLGATLPASWGGTDVRAHLFPAQSHTYLIAVKASMATGLLPAQLHSA